ncbi:unnamed protein product [Mortierella alpina]
MGIGLHPSSSIVLCLPVLACPSLARTLHTTVTYLAYSCTLLNTPSNTPSLAATWTPVHAWRHSLEPGHENEQWSNWFIRAWSNSSSSDFQLAKERAPQGTLQRRAGTQKKKKSSGFFQLAVISSLPRTLAHPAAQRLYSSTPLTLGRVCEPQVSS